MILRKSSAPSSTKRWRRGYVTEWVRHLREQMIWGNDDPLFPATRITPENEPSV